MLRIAVCSLLVVTACSKKSDTPSKETPVAAPGGAFLTVDAYCSAFCDKLCGTCGQGKCDACKPRCYYGRKPDMLLDGKDPKIGLALTQKELDGCLAMITNESCLQIASGAVPPQCYTIQH